MSWHKLTLKVIDVLALLGHRCLGTHQVALKMIHPNLVAHPEAMQRFLDEVSVCMDLLHPCIVRVHNLEEWAGHCFFTMEYLEGRSLREWIIERNQVQKPPFNLQETISIIDPLLEALNYAHKHTIHRDIKPENIMVRGDFPDVSIKVLDFGIAKTLSTSRFTQTSQSLGTAYYMSPEQMTDAGGIDHRADLYSVGMILYEMLTGKMAIGIPVLPSKQFPDLPKELDDMIVRLLSVSPGDRYSDADRTRKALSKVFKTNQADLVAKKKEEEANKQKEVEIARMLEKGRTLIEEREWAVAIELLTRARRLAPENKQINEPLTIAKNNLKKKEDEINAIIEKGKILIIQRQWAEAIEYLTRAKKNAPENKHIKEQLTVAKSNLAKKEAEIAGMLEKGRKLIEECRWAEAIEILTRSKRLSPKSKEINESLTIAKNNLKKLELLLKDAGKAEKENQHERAISLLVKADKLSADSDSVNSRIVKLQKKNSINDLWEAVTESEDQGDYDHALKLLKKLSKSAYNQEAVKKRLAMIETKRDDEIQKAHRKAKKWIFIFVGGLVVLIIACVIFFTKNPFTQPETANLKMSPYEIKSRFLKTSQSGRLFVITGKVRNDSSQTRGAIKLKGKLYAEGPTLIKSETIFCGNTISDANLTKMNMAKIRKKLSNRFADNKQKIRAVEPGQSIPFMVVFSDLPDNLHEYIIEVTDSTIM